MIVNFTPSIAISRAYGQKVAPKAATAASVPSFKSSATNDRAHFLNLAGEYLECNYAVASAGCDDEDIREANIERMDAIEAEFKEKNQKLSEYLKEAQKAAQEGDLD